ncbi:MAG: Spy/CpxP family protein refolding chaperone [Gemmatimonadaceae bacterium]
MSWMRIAVAGLALCASASVATAQGTPGGAEHGKAHGKEQKVRGHARGHAMLFDGITLTAAQQASIDGIRAKYRAEHGKTMQSGNTPNGGRQDEAARTKMAGMMEQQNADIRAVLDADQQKVFDANVATMKERRDKMRMKQPRA